jgi:hypothetical protein
MEGADEFEMILVKIEMIMFYDKGIKQIDTNLKIL